MNQADQVKEKLATLEESLTQNLPNINTLLRTIHQQLKKDAEIVTVLTDEECAILVLGLKKQTDTEIATAALKGGKGKSLKSTTLDDL